MRHGEAEAPRLDDRGRQLTATGKTQTNDATKWLYSTYCTEKSVDLAIVSPYLRTRQTFDVLSTHIVPNKSEVSDDVVPNGNADLVHDYLYAKVQRAINSPNPLKKVLVVSHMPLVSYLVDSLCGTFTTCLFATAAIAVVKYDPVAHKGELITHYQGNF